MKAAHNREGGFTLTELLISIAIVGALAAIAVPVYGQTKDYADNEAIAGALKTVAARLQTQNLIWGGAERPAYGVCQGSPTYPSDPGGNLCAAGAWRLFDTENPTVPLAPPVTGEIPAEITVTGIVDPTGRFCIDASSSSGGTPQYLAGSMAVNQDDSVIAPAEGSCQGITWEPVDVEWPTASPSTTTTEIDPGPTTNTAVDVSTGALSLVVANPTPGYEYLITVDGFAPSTVIATSTGAINCWYPSDTQEPCVNSNPDGPLPAGTYVTSVRSRNPAAESGTWSAPTEHRITVED